MRIEQNSLEFFNSKMPGNIITGVPIDYAAGLLFVAGIVLVLGVFCWAVSR